MTNFWRDVRYSLRLLGRSPGFAFVSILTVALGIGGTTFVFAVVDAVLLRPLPYHAAHELVALTAADTERDLTGIAVSFTKVERLRQASKSLTAVGAWYPLNVSLRMGSVPDELHGARANRDLFRALGVIPVIGRNFTVQEDERGGPDVVLLSDHLWRTTFGADPTVVGRTVTVDTRQTTIVGVLPRQFRFPFIQPEPDLWVPRPFESPAMTDEKVRSGAGYLQVIARATTGVSIRGIQADLKAIDSAYRQDFPGFADSPEDLVATPLKESLVGPVQASVLVVFAAITLLLLIGCVNLMNLLLSRGTARIKEVAVRLVVGATRAQVVRQLLTESLLVAFLGSLVGIAVAVVLSLWLPSLLAGTLPRSEDINVRGTVILFCVGVSVATAVAFGLIPAFQLTRESLEQGLREGGRSSTTGRRSEQYRLVLVAAEVSLAVVLLSGAGIVLKSLIQLMRVDAGFDSSDLTTFSVSLPTARYHEPAAQREFFRKAIDQLRSIPGIQSAAAVNALPVAGITPMIYFCPEGFACKGLGKDPTISFAVVTPEYLTVMGIPLLRGRPFDDHDTSDSQNVCIVNQSGADLYFRGTDAIGKTLHYSRDLLPRLVIGVAKDVRFAGLNVPPAPEMYVPETQSPLMFPTMNIAIRSASDERAVIAAAKKVIADVDPDVPIADVADMRSLVALSTAQQRLMAVLGFSFAAVALILTTLGIYGVLALWVSHRSREIGIRMALGATERGVVRLVVARGMKASVAGLVCGLVAAVALTKFLNSILFSTNPRDPLILGSVMLVVFCAALFACSWPVYSAISLNAGTVLFDR